MLNNDIFLNYIYQLLNLDVIHNIRHQSLYLSISHNGQFICLIKTILNYKQNVTNEFHIIDVDYPKDIIKLILPHTNNIRSHYHDTKWLFQDQLVILTKTHRVLYPYLSSHKINNNYNKYIIKSLVGSGDVINNPFSSQIYINENSITDSQSENIWNGKLVMETDNAWAEKIGRNIYLLRHSITRSHSNKNGKHKCNTMIIDITIKDSKHNNIIGKKQKLHRYEYSILDVEKSRVFLWHETFKLKDINTTVISRDNYLIYHTNKQIKSLDYQREFLRFIGYRGLPQIVNNKFFNLYLSNYYNEFINRDKQI